MRGRSRRTFAAAFSAILGLMAFGAVAAPPAPAPAPEMSLGSPKAPVTVIEYASVGCPHCGVWAREVFPAFKAKYIATGRARFVFHELLTGDPALAAAGFLLARCVQPSKYFQVVDAIFADQDRIAAEGPAGQLLQIAKTAGLTEAQYSACLADEAALDAMNARTEKDAHDHGVTGTPTFFVGGEKLTGEQSLAALDAAIARAAPKH